MLPMFQFSTRAFLSSLKTNFDDYGRPIGYNVIYDCGIPMENPTNFVTTNRVAVKP